MTQGAIDYIIQKLRTIEGIANVSECLPFVPNLKALQEYFQQQIQAWEVSNIAGKHNADTQNVVQFTETLMIDGWLLYKDAATKRQMQAIIDAIKVTFANDRKLGKHVIEVKTFQLIFNQADWFFETVFMHHCRFQFDVVILL